MSHRDMRITAAPGMVRSPALLLLAALAATACDGEAQQTKKRRQRLPQVALARVERIELVDRLELTGSIEPVRTARMVAPVEGPVVALAVREGDRVRAGQRLVRIGRARGDDASEASARAALDREQLELERVERLVASGALPGEKLDEARVRVSEARARLARASEKLGDYRIRAPWAGVVGRVHVVAGDFVAARAPLLEVFDPDSLVLRFGVPEDRAADLAAGQLVQARLDAFADRRFAGAVTRLYPEIDRRSHTRTVEAELDTDAALAPGMFARLQLRLATVDALAVPREALLHPGDGGPLVVVISADRKAERRRVGTGIDDGDRVQIRSGLEAGERVAVAGHGRLRDGMQVRLAGAGKPKDARNAGPGKGQSKSQGKGQSKGQSKSQSKGQSKGRAQGKDQGKDQGEGAGGNGGRARGAADR